MGGGPFRLSLKRFYRRAVGDGTVPSLLVSGIALFPLAIQLGIAAYKNDLKILPYVFPLIALGAIFALYQVIGHYFPFLL